MLINFLLITNVLANALCPSISDKKSFYKANKIILEHMVKHKRHQVSRCQPVMNEIRCEPIAYFGKKNRPYFECRVKLFRHKDYKGTLKMSDQHENCFLTFHMVGNRVLRKPFQNRCFKPRKKQWTRFGPWSRCLDVDCASEHAIQIKRRFCNGPRCAEFDFDRWLHEGGEDNEFIQSRTCKHCREPSSNKCELEVPYLSRKSLINDEWPIDEYPKTLDDCDEFIYYENGVELDTCGCIDLINRTYVELLAYLKE